MQAQASKGAVMDCSCATAKGQTARASGLCMCGCGRKTKIVTKSHRRHGHEMGQPFETLWAL